MPNITYLSLNLLHTDRAFKSILIPSQQVIEIVALTLSQVSPVPDVESPVMGIYPWRGEILWVMDGNALLGGSAIHEQRDRIPVRYSVLMIQESGEHLGILVPSVGNLVRLDQNSPIDLTTGLPTHLPTDLPVDLPVDLHMDSQTHSPIVDLQDTIRLFRRQHQPA